MFINKLKEKSVSDSPKIMSSYINIFLKTEITCIPKLLKKYVGNYYDNALCNGATWIFALWCVLHAIYDKCMDEFLKKVRYKEYVRVRLKSSLWYLGFYTTALIYCGTTLVQNEIELFNFKKMHVPSASGLPTQVMLGYTLISTFYLHSSLWEGLTEHSLICMLNYLFLFALLVSSYILRVVEISFTLTALISVGRVTVEFTRCCLMSSNQDSLISKLIIAMLYFGTFAISIVVYIIVIPLTFVIPLGLKLLSDYPNILLLFLYFNLMLWLLTEIYSSVLFKFVDHWLYHGEKSENETLQQCSSGLLECSLFKPRDDVSYNLQIIKQEIKARETKMMSMRKPKNKSVLLQTLKCMVAIKRKLNKRHLPDSSDSDDSEKSDESELKTSENTDAEIDALQTEHDEESDDEESESQGSADTEKNYSICKVEPQVENDDDIDTTNGDEDSSPHDQFNKHDNPPDILEDNEFTSTESDESSIETTKVSDIEEDNSVVFAGDNGNILHTSNATTNIDKEDVTNEEETIKDSNNPEDHNQGGTKKEANNSEDTKN